MPGENPAPVIRAIVFDLDNTLVDFMSMKKLAVEAAIDAMIDAGLTLDREEAEREIFAIYEREGIEYQRVFDDLFDFTEVFETNYPWGGRSLA